MTRSLSCTIVFSGLLIEGMGGETGRWTYTDMEFGKGNVTSLFFWECAWSLFGGEIFSTQFFGYDFGLVWFDLFGFGTIWRFGRL